MGPVSVEPGVGDLGEPVDQLVPQGGDMGGIALQVGTGLLQRSGQSRDPGQIFRAGPAVALLRAALDEGQQGQALRQ